MRVFSAIVAICGYAMLAYFGSWQLMMAVALVAWGNNLEHLLREHL